MIGIVFTRVHMGVLDLTIDEICKINGKISIKNGRSK